MRQIGGRWDRVREAFLFDADPTSALVEYVSAEGLNETAERPHYLGHRQRLRDRFRAAPEAVPDYELLELLLFFSIPRRDTKPLAKELLARFGSLGRVLAASSEEVGSYELVSSHTLVHFVALREVAARLAREEVADTGPLLGTAQAVLAYCRARLAHEGVEQLWALYLNSKNRLLADEAHQRGTVNHTPVYPRELVKRALALGATGLILAHNHPSGDPAPSRADIRMTEQIEAAAALLEIRLVDHLVIGRNGYSSFREMGLLS